MCYRELKEMTADIKPINIQHIHIPIASNSIAKDLQVPSRASSHA